MCGLIGIVHKDKNVYESICNGLDYLQYRGYDSCGIALINDNSIQVNKQIGSISGLKKSHIKGKIGIGHTRWATHGCISIKNTHPFIYENLAVIHNGIIENHLDIKEKYPDHIWKTESDTESILKLAYEYLNEYKSKNKSYNEDEAWEFTFKKLCNNLEGSFAVAFLDLNSPDKIFFIRKGLSALSIAVSDDFAAVASDCLALSDLAEYVIDIEDEQYGYIKLGEYKIFSGIPNEKRRIIKFPKMIDKSHDTWFSHEFNSQPMVLSNAMFKLNNTFTWPELTPKMIEIVGCGSAYLAGCVGKHWIEKHAKILCRIQMSSEWIDMSEYEKTLVLVSQSGETADTLSALKKIKSNNINTVGFVNTLGSTLSRSVDHIIPTFVGQEVSVASTKAMTGQMLSLYLWAHKLANVDKKDDLCGLFEKMDNLIKMLPSLSKEVIDICSHTQDLFILAKENLVPIAHEGALKIQELAYIHAASFSASELKHGPLAMINNNHDSSQAIIFLAPSSSKLWKKLLSSFEEVQSRGGKVIVMTDKPEAFKSAHAVVKMPYIDYDLAPFIYILPLQWLAYGLAIRKGNPIDMPRNLAKSVTVE